METISPSISRPPRNVKFGIKLKIPLKIGLVILFFTIIVFFEN